MAEVIWERVALDDLDDIVAYIERFDPAAALRYEMALRALGESLADFPNRGRPATGGTREMTSVPPYVLGYRVEADEVHVLSIRHGRRQSRA